MPYGGDSATATLALARSGSPYDSTTGSASAACTRSATTRTASSSAFSQMTANSSLLIRATVSLARTAAVSRSRRGRVSFGPVEVLARQRQPDGAARDVVDVSTCRSAAPGGALEHAHRGVVLERSLRSGPPCPRPRLQERQHRGEILAPVALRSVPPPRGVRGPAS